MATLVGAVKLTAWRATQSDAVLADAVESGVDVLTASFLVFAVRFARRPADAGHPYGHGKAEYFSAGAQGLVVIVAAIGLMTQAVHGWLNPHPLGDLQRGLVLSVVATVINLGLAVTLMRAGRRLGSPALRADGVHNLADVLTTFAAWTGVGVSAWTGWLRADALAAGAVALHVGYMGFSIAKDAVDGLMDSAWPVEERERALQVLRGALGPSERFEALRTRRAGAKRFLSAHIIVADDTRIDAGHRIRARVELALSEALADTEISLMLIPASSAEQVLPRRSDQD